MLILTSCTRLDMIIVIDIHVAKYQYVSFVTDMYVAKYHYVSHCSRIHRGFGSDITIVIDMYCS